MDSVVSKELSKIFEKVARLEEKVGFIREDLKEINEQFVLFVSNHRKEMETFKKDCINRFQLLEKNMVAHKTYWSISKVLVTVLISSFIAFIFALLLSII